MHKFRNIVFYLLAFIGSNDAYGQNPENFKNPDYFDADKTIVNQISIPRSILKSMKVDNSTGLYKACYIKLSSRNEKSILVQGGLGASTTDFSIFIKLGGAWVLVLQENGLDLTLKRLPRHGYRQIEVVGCWVSGCRHRVYKYNGNTYIPMSCYDQTDRGITKFKCPPSYTGPWPTVAR